MAKKFRKILVSVRVNPHLLGILDKLGEAVSRNRSEMIDRAIEEYVRNHASEPQPAQPKRSPRA